MEISSKKQENTILTNKKTKMFWGIVFFCIAFLSIVSVVSFNKNFSVSLFVSFFKSANLLWLGCAILCVILFIFFEGLSLRYIYSSFGYKGKKSSSFVYSAADIYFSAITPSASGGQPASAYFMLKDGISLPVVTISLLYTLLMYSLSIVVVVILSLLFSPSLFFSLNFLTKIIICVGFFIQFGLLCFFYFLLYKDKLLYRICAFFLKLLSKLHLVHSLDVKEQKLSEVMAKYQEAAQMVKGKKKVLVHVFFCNLFQRLSQIGVIVFVFLATSGNFKEALSIFVLQSFVIIGAYAAPIPGAIGVTDYLMLQGFGKIMSSETAVYLELLSRGLSFYLCVFICGLVIAVRYFYLKRSREK